MNAVAHPSTDFLFAARARERGIQWSVIAQVCVAIIPTVVTIDFSMPRLGGEYLAFILLILIGYHAIHRNRYKALSILFGCAPVLIVMRGEFFYNGIIFFLLMCLGACIRESWPEVRFVMKDPIWKWIGALSLLYWFLTFARTSYWANNIRIIEFALACAAFCLLANSRSYLATAFVGMAISVSAYAIAMLPYGVRLGEGDLDNGDTIGNPILVGIPSALVILLTLSDRGRYLLMESNWRGRIVLSLVAAQWLILSTSRASWVITAGGLILIFIFNSQSRKSILILLILAGAISVAVLSTQRGDSSQRYFDKTVDSNRTLANRTNGRSDMWAALPKIFAVSPVWGWGGGSGADVDKMYTGRHLLFHSLYLQILVESGLLGFIPLAIIIVAAVHRAVTHLRRQKELTPLIGIVAFILLGGTVSAFDITSGILFGMALMAREYHPRMRAQQMWLRSADEVAVA